MKVTYTQTMNNETQENNKLIAEFMGYIDNGCSEEGFLINPVTNYDEEICELKFHSDWNWIMSVVEKIETLNYDFKILGGNWVIITDIDPDRNEGEEIIEIGGKESKLKAVHTAVIEFIKWYNKQEEDLKIFYLGYKNATDDYLTFFESAKEADYNSEEWVKIQAKNEEEAKEKYEEEFIKWYNS